MSVTRETSPKYFYAIGQLLELAEKMGLQVKDSPVTPSGPRLPPGLLNKDRGTIKF